MRRREFLTFAGAAAALPLGARAQQTGKLPTIGFLGTRTRLAWSGLVPAFMQRLRELGWVEGYHIDIEYGWTDGSSERAAEIAAAYVRMKVDVIVTMGSAIAAARQATSVIPIVFVFAAATDPAGTHLERPGGNVTGLSNQAPDLTGKRLELLRELIPGLRRLAIMANVGHSAAGKEAAELQAAAGKAGLEPAMLEVRRADDIAPGFEAIKGRAQALYVVGDPLMIANRARIVIFALGARLPAVSSFRAFAEAGGLASYEVNTADRFRRAADYVDKILRGTKPGDLPVEQPTKFDLVVNLITAKALGIEIPPTLLDHADEVIE
jgi:putative ABC transport system substrate-binding protein